MPQSQSPDALELFQAYFHQLLTPVDPLVKLMGQIQWEAFERTFADCCCEDFVTPAKATRLMVGLHYLKHAFNESDESVMQKWVENPC